ncbi:MAG: SCO family protein [Planctomycetes bacterium]|nr:SCO family protein [Planctomycetota bacterium]
MNARAAILCSALATVLTVGHGIAQSGAIPVLSENAIMANKLGADADLGLKFVDEDGNSVVLRDLVSGERPIVLNLGFWECPLACGPILNAMLDALRNAEIVPGEKVDILSVSIDANEGPDIAKSKRNAFIKALGIPAAADHWRFVTSDDASIRALCDSVGYRFERIEGTNIIDHPPTIVILTPDGRVSRYLNGLAMTPVTFNRALVEAGEGTVGTFLERLFVSCLTYDPSSGAYSVAAMTVMRIAGAVTVLALGSLIFVLWRRERAKTLAVAT